jgi:hypothetical protein
MRQANFMFSKSTQRSAYGRKKGKVVAALEELIEKGEQRRSIVVAEELKVSPSLVRQVAHDARLSRAIFTRQGASVSATTIRVQAVKSAGQRVESPYIRIDSSIVRGARFKVGDELIARAEPGRILVMRRPA